MGVDIKALASDTKKVITLRNIMGKKVAIDAFNSLFQFLATIRQSDGTPLKDLNGNVTSHLSGLFYRTIYLIENDIKPLYVFDGPPNPLKKREIQKRREAREEAIKKFKEAQDLGREEDSAKYAQATSKLTGDMIEESKDLLRAMGVPVIQAKQDGEAQAAYLTSAEINDAWAVGSQDYDSFLFGANKIIRNLSQTRTKKVRNTTVKVDLEFFKLDDVLNSLDCSRHELIDVGILIGLDFFEGVPGIGPKTAYDLVKKHGDIEGIITQNLEIRKTTVNDYLDMEEVTQVRNIFRNPAVHTDYEKPKWKKPNDDKIFEILCEGHKFSKSRLENALDRIRTKGGSSQKTMDSFFS